MGFRDKLRIFMAGRNGVDALFYFMFVIDLILYGFNFIFRSPWLYYAQLIIIILAIYRLLSKNLERRHRENEAFKRILRKLSPNYELNKRKLVEGRTHSFHECPYCGAILRFERRRGKFNVTCPRCKHKITIKNWF